MVAQYEIVLPPFPRGFHLITDIVMKQITHLPQTGIFHLFIQHTSAGLTINENADTDVRIDFEGWFNRVVKENESYYRHVMEGSDDMPAHIKSSLTGHAISLPVTNHRLNLGTWQGIYLCEFRNNGGKRKLIATIIGI